MTSKYIGQITDILIPKFNILFYYSSDIFLKVKLSIFSHLVKSRKKITNVSRNLGPSSPQSLALAKLSKVGLFAVLDNVAFLVLVVKVGVGH